MQPARGVVGLFGGLAGLAVFGAVLASLIRWEPMLSDPVDPGPVDFANLVRKTPGGDALICPKSLCMHAQPDLEPPIFTSPADRLENRLRVFASRSALIDEIRTKQSGDRLRFVQRSSVFGTPTYIDILIDPRSSGAATVAMYARARSSSSHARDLSQLRAWLTALAN